MVQQTTIDFMTTLGEVATGVNAFLLALFGMGLLVVAFDFIRGQKEDPNGESSSSMRVVGISMIPLAILTAYVAWFVMQLVSSNSNLAGIVGLATFLRMIVFSF